MLHRTLLLIGYVVFPLLVTGQVALRSNHHRPIAQGEQHGIYEHVYRELTGMLEGRKKLDFKRAVFLSEQAWFDGQLDSTAFENRISRLVNLCRSVKESRTLLYDGEDKQKMATHAAIFSVLTDSIPMMLTDSSTAYHLPFLYDFDDVWGHQNWSQMFVVKLLETNAGNCHSMPLLYKLLAQELGTDAHLAYAPNHTYIKLQSKQFGWFNTELTSGAFPIDAWLMASGFVHLDAIRNRVYMHPLNEQQSLALILVDLAKGYEDRFGFNGGDFQLEVIQTALQYHPENVNALLLKAELLRKRYFNQIEANQAASVSSYLPAQATKDRFREMEQVYATIHRLGYRQMPEQMYLDWLVSLKTEKEKYQNKKITNLTKPRTP